MMKECVCSSCGHEQSSMNPCEYCNSIRVVLVSVLEDHFGPDWRSVFSSTLDEICDLAKK